MSEDNPYQFETTVNTTSPWATPDLPELSADLDGIRDYAKKIAAVSQDIQGPSATVAAHLAEMPKSAWAGDPLAEMEHVRAYISYNAAELAAYFQQLGTTMTHIGAAAKTIADVYQHGDGYGAASINDVLFAFGDQNVPRPKGLPSYIGQTYLEADVEAQMKAAADGTAPAEDLTPFDKSDDKWEVQSATSSPYGTTQVMVNPSTGQTMKIVNSFSPSSNVVTAVTTITDHKGHVISSSTTRTTTTSTINGDGTASITKTVDSIEDGRTTSRQQTTEHYTAGTVDDKTTTENQVKYDSKGKETVTETSTTSTHTYSDGSTHEQTTTPGETKDDDRVTTDDVWVGAKTDGPSTDPGDLGDLKAVN